MTYPERAARFLAARRAPPTAPAPDEIDEGNEESRAAATVGALPRDCIGPRACAVLGPCERHDGGRPCLVTNGGAHAV